MVTKDELHSDSRMRPREIDSNITYAYDTKSMIFYYVKEHVKKNVSLEFL